MIILGVDPGTARVGWAIVEHQDEPRAISFGCLETDSSLPMPERLRQIHLHVSDLVREFRPDVVVVEQLFFARNVTNALAVGQARGVILLAAALSGLPVNEYTPAEVKQAVVGYGKADKRQLQEMVRLILGLETVPTPDDAADALAVALCHAHSSAFLERARMSL